MGACAARLAGTIVRKTLQVLLDGTATLFFQLSINIASRDCDDEDAVLVGE